uniref:Protein LHCP TRANSLOCATION DEFECT n=1 Tax=Aegilops tauschii subsp. strangulata TaxID=200361 RepID=A0A453BDT0_AEGTS
QTSKAPFCQSLPCCPAVQDIAPLQHISSVQYISKQGGRQKIQKVQAKLFSLHTLPKYIPNSSVLLILSLADISALLHLSLPDLLALQQAAKRHGLHPVHHPARDQDGVLVVGVEVAAGGTGRAEDPAAGRRRSVAAAVTVEQGGAGEGERQGGVLQVREQGRGGRRHLRQPSEGRLRPRRRRAGENPFPELSLNLHCCMRSASDKNGRQYFNYMGMLAVEGTYDKMEALLNQSIHPVDILLILAASEGDLPKIEELLKAGAKYDVKDADGRTALDRASGEVREFITGFAVAKKA